MINWLKQRPLMWFIVYVAIPTTLFMSVLLIIRKP